MRGNGIGGLHQLLIEASQGNCWHLIESSRWEATQSNRNALTEEERETADLHIEQMHFLQKARGTIGQTGISKAG